MQFKHGLILTAAKAEQTDKVTFEFMICIKYGTMGLK